MVAFFTNLRQRKAADGIHASEEADWKKFPMR